MMKLYPRVYPKGIYSFMRSFAAFILLGLGTDDRQSRQTYSLWMMLAAFGEIQNAVCFIFQSLENLLIDVLLRQLRNLL